MHNGMKPYLSSIQEFRTIAYVKDKDVGKLDAWAQVSCFVDYDSESKGYRIYWPYKRTISVKHNVVFNEDDITYLDEVTIQTESLSEGERSKVIQCLNESPSDSTTDKLKSENEPNRPGNLPTPAEPNKPVEQPKRQAEWLQNRPPQMPGFYSPQLAKIATIEAHISHHLFKEESNIKVSHFKVCFKGPSTKDDEAYSAIFVDYDALVSNGGNSPKMLDEALSGPKASEWQTANEYKLNQLTMMGTWEVVDLPKGEKAIPYQIVFKEKLDGEGNINTYQVWIVMGGHKQIEEKEYTETFTAAAKSPSVCVILVNAVYQDWEIHQVDIKNMYLNVPLKKTVYMKPPPWALKAGEKGKACKLLKGLYGLHQAGCVWYKEMSQVFINELGFKKSAVYHSVFYWRTKDGHTVVAVAMDDIAITSKQLEDVEKLKKELQQFWKILNLRELNWYLGFQVKRTGNLELYP